MAQWQIGHNGGGVGQAWLYTGDANGDAGGPRASDDDAVRVLRGTGELDVSAVSPMLPGLVALVAGAQGVILDLTAVTFIDSSGVRLVDQLARECGGPARRSGSSRRPADRVGECSSW